MGYDTTTSVTDSVSDNLASYHNQLKTAIDHVMSSSPYSAYVTAASMTGNVTLTDSDYPIQSYSPTAARDLTLPAVASTNHAFFVYNRSGSFAITVKNAGGTTIGTVSAGTSGMFFSDGTNGWTTISGGSSSASGDKYAMEFRLTLETGVPISTSDQTGKTTIYCTPYLGNQIALYDGSSTWTTYSSAEFSLALGTLTSGLPYDVFCYNNSGTPTLEFTAWTNGTTRATALTRQNGILVKSGSTTRRYLGTFYTTATTTTEDSEAKRFLYNYYNRRPRTLNKQETTTSWTYNSSTIHQANASTANKVEVIMGVAEDVLSVSVLTSATGSGFGYVGIGEDSTSTFTTSGYYQGGGGASGSEWFVFSAYLRKIPAVGYHYYSWNERTTTAVVTFWGGTSTDNWRAGIFGEISC